MNEFERVQLLREQLINEIKENHPKFSIKFKDQNKFQYHLSKIAKYLGTDYMKYTTTIFSTVWFSNQEVYEKNPAWDITVLLHEWIHLHDQKKYPVIFHISYFLMLPFVFTMRSYWEKRGYTTNLMVFKKRKFTKESISEMLVPIFTGVSGYFWMWPFPKKINLWIEKTMESPPTEYPYNRVQYYIDELYKY